MEASTTALQEFSLTAKLSIACIALFLVYDWWCHQYFQRRGIRVGPYYPIIGSLLHIRKGLGFRFPKEYHQKYGRIFGWYEGRSPQLVINDADTLKHIFVKNFSHFVNRRTNMIRTKPLDKGLLALRDEHWKDVRAVVTPAFSAVKMKQMTSMINECCDALVANFGRAAAANRPADCKQLYGGFTMDSVAWCGFGLRVNSQENDDEAEFVIKAKQAFDSQFVSKSLALSLIFPALLPVFNYFNVGHMPVEVTSFFSEVTEEACRLRKDHGATVEGSKQIDMLQLLLNAHEDAAEEADECSQEAGPQFSHRGKKRALTTEEITAQALTFFLAGYETTNSLLGFASFLLALNQDIQEKLYSEIEDAIPTRDDVSYESINKMTYLDMVISEALRCYPPAGGFVRTCNKTFSHNGITIDEGVKVYTSIWSIHYDEEYWPNADKFEPERFSAENKGSIKPCTWLPFGFGPRNCIGMRFALLETKMALVRVLQQYRLDICPETQIPLKLAEGPFASPKEGIQLRPVPRK